MTRDNHMLTKSTKRDQKRELTLFRDDKGTVNARQIAIHIADDTQINQVFPLKLEHAHNYYFAVKLKDNKIMEAPQVSQRTHLLTDFRLTNQQIINFKIEQSHSGSSIKEVSSMLLSFKVSFKAFYKNSH